MYSPEIAKELAPTHFTSFIKLRVRIRQDKLNKFNNTLNERENEKFIIKYQTNKDGKGNHLFLKSIFLTLTKELGENSFSKADSKTSDRKTSGVL